MNYQNCPATCGRMERVRVYHECQDPGSDSSDSTPSESDPDVDPSDPRNDPKFMADMQFHWEMMLEEERLPITTVWVGFFAL